MQFSFSLSQIKPRATNLLILQIMCFVACLLNVCIKVHDVEKFTVVMTRPVNVCAVRSVQVTTIAPVCITLVIQNVCEVTMH
jgi:hypothetical protein